MPAQPIALPPVPEGPDRPTILARVYPGTHADAVELFQQDAEVLAQHGYFPVGQSYADGRYPAWMVGVAIVLCLIAIGIVMLAIMAAVRPEGTLAVTYELRRAV